MSDEQRKDEEAEVEAHNRGLKSNIEPSDETQAESEDDVEAHVRGVK
jgi:hypothetical protein